MSAPIGDNAGPYTDAELDHARKENWFSFARLLATIAARDAEVAAVGAGAVDLRRENDRLKEDVAQQVRVVGHWMKTAASDADRRVTAERELADLRTEVAHIANRYEEGAVFLGETGILGALRAALRASGDLTLATKPGSAGGEPELDSPPFTPPALDEMRAKGYERTNRHAEPPPAAPTKVTCEACGTRYVPGERHGCAARPAVTRPSAGDRAAFTREAHEYCERLETFCEQFEAERDEARARVAVLEEALREVRPLADEVEDGLCWKRVAYSNCTGACENRARSILAIADKALGDSQ